MDVLNPMTDLGSARAPSLHDLARAAGVSLQWRDYRGQDRAVTDQALGRVLHALELPASTPRDCADSLRRLREEASASVPMVTAEVGAPVSLPCKAIGRYRLELEDGRALEGELDGHGDALPPIDRPGYHRLLIGSDAPVTVAVAPRQCMGIADLGARRRRWGLTVQVPSLRRRGDGGIGDFGAVAQLVPALARHGADAIALSPAHAGFGAWPDRFAPYSPSSRLMRNPLLADPRALFDAETIDGMIALCDLADTFVELERAPSIDPGRAARAKSLLFRGLFACLEPSGRRAAFDEWRASQGPLVRQHAVFEALHARFSRGPDPVTHWRSWPSDFRDPSSPIVERFAAEHAGDIEFGEFLQWLAECSIAAAQGAARQAGMAIGLIADLAVGTDSAGSHAWSRQHDLLLGLRIGAPPDPLNVKGQDWGLAALSPRTLRREGFRPFIELLRANLAGVGGLRIDHVFGLQRLWLIADGTDASEGAYVQYPLKDLLRLLALESWRHGALIVGEDLGTMPDGFQSQLIDAGLMGMRVMWFQRDSGYFVEPARWPEAAVAMTSTHDLPTVAGWWTGRDLEWRARLDLLDPEQTEAQAQAERARDRRTLWDAFAHAHVVARDSAPPDATQAAQVVCAAATFIGRTPCGLALLPIEDALALPEQPNIPGTIDEHPNWRHRLPGEAGTLLEDPVPDAVLSALQRARIDGPT